MNIDIVVAYIEMEQDMDTSQARKFDDQQLVSLFIEIE